MQRSGKHLSKKIGTTGKGACCLTVNEGGKGQKRLKREPEDTRRRNRFGLHSTASVKHEA
jgi:hypothetical protein